MLKRRERNKLVEEIAFCHKHFGSPVSINTPFPLHQTSTARYASSEQSRFRIVTPCGDSSHLEPAGRKCEGFSQATQPGIERQARCDSSTSQSSSSSADQEEQLIGQYKLQKFPRRNVWLLFTEACNIEIEATNRAPSGLTERIQSGHHLGTLPRQQSVSRVVRTICPRMYVWRKATIPGGYMRCKL